MPKISLSLMLCLFISPSLLASETLHFESPEARTQILELYTSEGCSSCPPADRWLSKLKQAPGLWKDFIPLAFHVDYWDYLGWQDRFAMPSFSARQRQYAAQQSLNTVYTPGFILNGLEWRRWFKNPRVDIPGTGQLGGVLRTDIDTQQFRVHYQPSNGLSQKLGERLVVNLVKLGFDETTAVKRGENHGRELRHDFVVLSHERYPLKKQGEDFQAVLETPGDLLTTSKTPQAVVVWVNRPGDLAPLQATGGFISE